MLHSTWDAVIEEADGLPVDAYICFARLPITGVERVVIAQEDDWQADDDDVPMPAAEEGMTACLTKGDLVQVIANAAQQDPTVPRELLRQAVAYYFENDAFLTIDQHDR